MRHEVILTHTDAQGKVSNMGGVRGEWVFQCHRGAEILPGPQLRGRSAVGRGQVGQGPEGFGGFSLGSRDFAPAH